MTVAGHGEGVGEGVALFDEDLVANAAAGGEKVNGVLAGEGLYGSVLGEVLGGLVLDIVVETSCLGLWTRLAPMELKLWEGNVGQRMSSNRPGTCGQ